MDLSHTILKKNSYDKLLYGVKLNNEQLKTLENNKINIIELGKYTNNDSMREILRFVNKYKLMSQFITKLSKGYDKYCCLLIHILDKIYNLNLGEMKLLVDYYKKPFYLKI